MKEIKTFFNFLFKYPNTIFDSRQSGNEYFCAFRPFSKEFIKNPYPFFQQLRLKQPIHKSSMGAWVVSRYEDIVQILGDPRFSNMPAKYAVVNRRNRYRYICADVACNTLPFLDPPEHSLIRKVISSRFHEIVKNNPPDYKNIAEKIIHDNFAKNQIDLLKDYSTPVALRVISIIMGIPAKDELFLKKLSEYFFYMFNVIPSMDIRVELDKSLIKFRNYFSLLIEEKKKKPGKDLLSILIQDCKENKINEIELIDNCMLIFSDGVENVDKAIATSAALLIKHPDQLQKLLNSPDQINLAVDECLRYESPAQFISRIAKEDCFLHNINIKKNDALFLLLASANRDEKKFKDPDKFIIDRVSEQYLSFGRGNHSCIGASLVKRETEIAISVLLDLLPRLNLIDQDLQWSPRLGHRWLERLMVEKK